MNYNYLLFRLINQYSGHNLLLDNTAIYLAKYLPILFLLILIFLWLKKDYSYKNIVLYSIYSLFLGMFFNFVISLCYYHPRPFVLHLGHTLIKHPPDTSFPSDHVTFMLSIAIELLLFKLTRKIGIILFILGIIGGILRIYCGIHFPYDVIGSVIVSMVAAFIIYLLKNKLIFLNKVIISSLKTKLLSAKKANRIINNNK